MTDHIDRLPDGTLVRRPPADFPPAEIAARNRPSFVACRMEGCRCGQCHCGCGGDAAIAWRSDSRDGTARGLPMRFISGHHKPVTGPPDLTLFLSHVRRGSPDECWPWDSGTGRRGYGRWVVQRNGERKRYTAHRVAYEIVNGPIPDGLLVCHHCDNPPCCNPAHLFVGTNADNLADMTAKGRRVLPNPRPQYGTANGNAKLTDAQVRDIRANPSGLGSSALGRLYGVTPSAIRFIQIRGTWKHVS